MFLANLIRQLALLVNTLALRLWALTNGVFGAADNLHTVYRAAAVASINRADKKAYGKVVTAYAAANSVERLAEHMFADADDAAEAYTASALDRAQQLALVQNETL
jgi:hypothetical protein